MKIPSFLYLCLLCMLSMSCQINDIYNDIQKIPDAKWHSKQEITFQTSIHDTLVPLDVYIQLRNNQKYPYSNLYLFLTTIFPDQTAYRDTLECILASPEGQWLGKRTGTVFESRFLIKHNVLFPRSGRYVFKIAHAMREAEINGITEVGIKIAKPQNR
ncbi:MAG TPA: gliding motility lipoprotein GldH [Bacteroidales bacterium]|nr:gliding motility lipoprotein GldH [Bacteroidales bacterium]